MNNNLIILNYLCIYKDHDRKITFKKTYTAIHKINISNFSAQSFFVINFTVSYLQV